MPISELDKLSERGSANHARLIDDDGCSRCEVVAIRGRAVGAVVFVEELGQGVGGESWPAP